jgi:hypothetical protein
MPPEDVDLHGYFISGCVIDPNLATYICIACDYEFGARLMIWREPLRFLARTMTLDFFTMLAVSIKMCKTNFTDPSHTGKCRNKAVSNVGH